MVVSMLLSEALLLLLLDDEKGSPVHAGYAHDEGLAGAVLLDLLEAGALAETDASSSPQASSPPRRRSPRRGPRSPNHVTPRRR